MKTLFIYELPNHQLVCCAAEDQLLVPQPGKGVLIDGKMLWIVEVAETLPPAHNAGLIESGNKLLLDVAKAISKNEVEASIRIATMTCLGTAEVDGYHRQSSGIFSRDQILAQPLDVERIIFARLAERRPSALNLVAELRDLLIKVLDGLGSLALTTHASKEQ
jgi:hypothetical protein